jgi:signal transduction histidine kinase/ActR/RegA family two-component response regulator
MAPPNSSAPDDSRFQLSARWQARLHRLVGHILVEDGELIARWRARLTASLLFAAATLGLLPAVATIVVSLRDGIWPMLLLDSALLAIVYTLLLSRRVTNRWRNLFLAAASFSVGVVALITLGPFSTALSWLLVSVFLSTFLLGPRVTIGLGVALVLVMIGIAVGIHGDWFAWSVNDPNAMTRWMLTAFDFFFQMVIFGGANSLIIQLLEKEDHARVLAESQLAEGRRNEALGTLAGGIAHDFNNLLVPVLANVESVHDGLPARSDEARALRDALRSAERARDLVQRILAFGRGVDAERMHLDPCAVAQDVVGLARLTAPAGVTIAMRCTVAEPLHASMAELHQVLHNLVTNAVHAVEPPGTVTIDVHPVLRDGAPWVQLQVTDSGIGMDAETRERIFDPYFSTRAPGRGTGLGLPIVRSIVTSLGGEVQVESRLGAGSRFTVRLPASPLAVRHADDETAPSRLTPSRATPTYAMRPATHAARATPAQSVAAPAVAAPALPPGTHVLLVDDEASVRRATARLLESMGCQVTMAGSATAALELLVEGQLRPALLLTDHRMPGRSGVELLRDAQSLPQAPPAILMSGHLDDAMSDGHTLDGVVCLHKPFSRAELTAAVVGALGTERPHAEHVVSTASTASST